MYDERYKNVCLNEIFIELDSRDILYLYQNQQTTNMVKKIKRKQ